MDLRWIVFLLLNHLIASQNDQCTNYQTLNDTSFRTDSNSQLSSFCGLFPPRPWQPRWYRFTSTQGGEIATQCPQNSSCGAENQLWIDDSLPVYSDSEKSVRTCLKMSTDCCALDGQITVTTCNGFFVYKLDPVPGCSRFCINVTASPPPIISTTTWATSTLPTSASNSTTAITTSKRTDVPTLYITSQPTTMETTSIGTDAPTSLTTKARNGEDFSTEITLKATDDTTAPSNLSVNSSHATSYQTSTAVQTVISNSNSTPVTSNSERTEATTTSQGSESRESHPPSEHSDTLSVVVASVGSAVGLAVIAVVVFLLYRKKCKDNKGSRIKSTYILPDDIPVAKEEGFVEKRKFEVKSIGQQADTNDLAPYKSNEDFH